MTLDKKASRETIDMFFTLFNPLHRFEVDISDNVVTLTAQKAKQRIPHDTQVKLSEDPETPQTTPQPKVKDVESRITINENKELTAITTAIVDSQGRISLGRRLKGAKVRVYAFEYTGGRYE